METRQDSALEKLNARLDLKVARRFGPRAQGASEKLEDVPGQTDDTRVHREAETQEAARLEAVRLERERADALLAQYRAQTEAHHAEEARRVMTMVESMQRELEDMRVERAREREMAKNVQTFLREQLRNIRTTSAQTTPRPVTSQPDLATSRPTLYPESSGVINDVTIKGEVRWPSTNLDELLAAQLRATLDVATKTDAAPTRVNVESSPEASARKRPDVRSERKAAAAGETRHGAQPNAAKRARPASAKSAERKGRDASSQNNKLKNTPKHRGSSDKSDSDSTSESSDQDSDRSDSSSLEDVVPNVPTVAGPGGTMFTFRPYVNASALEDVDEKASLAVRTRWLERFQSIAVQGGWTDKVKIYEMKLKLSTAVRNWRANLRPKVRRDWKKFLKEFREMYCKAKTSDSKRYYTMTQRKSENPLEFYYRLNKVADKAGIDFDSSSKQRERQLKVFTKKGGYYDGPPPKRDFRADNVPHGQPERSGRAYVIQAPRSPRSKTGIAPSSVNVAMILDTLPRAAGPIASVTAIATRGTLLGWLCIVRPCLLSLKLTSSLDGDPERVGLKTTPELCVLVYVGPELRSKSQDNHQCMTVISKKNEEYLSDLPRPNQPRLEEGCPDNNDRDDPPEFRLGPGQRYGWWKEHSIDETKKVVMVHDAVNNCRTDILLDSGASISMDVARRLKLRLKFCKQLRVSELGGVPTIITATTEVKITLGPRVVYIMELWVANIGEGVDVLLGMNFMYSAGVRLCAREGLVKFPDEETVLLARRTADHMGRGLDLAVTPKTCLYLGPGESAVVRIDYGQSNPQREVVWADRGDRWVTQIIYTAKFWPVTVNVVNISDKTVWIDCRTAVYRIVSGEILEDRDPVILLDEDSNSDDEAFYDAISFDGDDGGEGSQEVVKAESSSGTWSDRLLLPVRRLENEYERCMQMSAEELSLEPAFYIHEGGELLAQLRDELAMLSELRDLNPECDTDKADVGEPGRTTPAEEEKLRTRLRYHHRIFLGDGNAASAPARGVWCDLDVGDAKPVAQRPCSIAPHLAIEVYELLKKLLETGLIGHWA
ncbi:unnamed protein product [Phytophthora fragariaefolia]|uniref:Unnamed protein product n=1 Tax=Phytophthora fragariaefolia TaxID=1490495 RepID=A0A9W6YMI1_9STRA|nr:unnamed protein product [Phytophthora fragariaefolia]